MYFPPLQKFNLRWLKKRFLQYPSSEALLESAENEILTFLKTPFKIFFVNIGPVVGREDYKIRTLSINGESTKAPIVLLHGLGQGIGFWILNLDAIAAERPVYAIDLPGFGRSSRQYFSADAAETETQMVDCLEAWRREMKLDSFILLGFSLGGFLAASYAWRYPNRLLHLILMDPWGFPKGPSTFKEAFFNATVPFPVHPLVGSVFQLLIRRCNALLFIRATGKLHLGHTAIRVTTPMLQRFSIFGEEAVEKMIDYIFHCNAQKPTGEAAFYSMSSTAGQFWALLPMSERISVMQDRETPVTLIYGTKSWLCKMPVTEIRDMLPNSFVDEHLIEGARHDCYIDDSQTFNKLIVRVCELFDPIAKK